MADIFGDNANADEPLNAGKSGQINSAATSKVHAMIGALSVDEWSLTFGSLQ